MLTNHFRINFAVVGSNLYSAPSLCYLRRLHGDICHLITPKEDLGMASDSVDNIDKASEINSEPKGSVLNVAARKSCSISWWF